MLFATRVFQAAGIWGLLLLGGLYLAYLAGAGEFSVVTSHPQYVHGFFLLGLAWQVAFLMIATDPIRYRLMMLVAMLEKFPFTLATLLLYSNGDIPASVLGAGLIDGLLGVLFGVSYAITADSADAD